MCPTYNQNRDCTYDEKCVIFSFGVVLLEIISGFEQGSDGKALQEDIEGLTTNAQQWKEEVLIGMKKVASECTRSRECRFDSMRKVFTRLLNIANHCHCQFYLGTDFDEERQHFYQVAIGDRAIVQQ